MATESVHEYRKQDILRHLERVARTQTFARSNVEIANAMGYSYRAVQQATHDLDVERKIIGYVVGVVIKFPGVAVVRDGMSRRPVCAHESPRRD